MQAFFEGEEGAIEAFRATLSAARFSKYLKSCNGDARLGARLYHWNTLLSQSMYLPLQTWEVSLRNKLNGFLIWKYNAKWPYDDRALRTLTRDCSRRLEESKLRLDPQKRMVQVSTDAIVADLSAGFWVSLLTRSYDIPFAWRYNLPRVFPQLQKGRDRLAISEMCDRMLVLRNRVAHHEPIHHLDLQAIKGDLDELIASMCPAASQYASSACTFARVWGERPQPQAANDEDAQAPAAAVVPENIPE
jgi:hypothetical protein